MICMLRFLLDIVFCVCAYFVVLFSLFTMNCLLCFLQKKKTLFIHCMCMRVRMLVIDLECLFAVSSGEVPSMQQPVFSPSKHYKLEDVPDR